MHSGHIFKKGLKEIRVTRSRREKQVFLEYPNIFSPTSKREASEK